MDLPNDIIMEIYTIIRVEKDALTLSVMRSVCKTWCNIVKPFRLTAIHVKRRYQGTHLYIRTETSDYREYNQHSRAFEHVNDDQWFFHSIFRFDHKILSHNLLWKFEIKLFGFGPSQPVYLTTHVGGINCHRPRELMYEGDGRDEIWLEYE
jgi:hypothetical protein